MPVIHVTRQLTARMDEHLSFGKGFDHLMRFSNGTLNVRCVNMLSFKIINQAKFEFYLKIKEAIHKDWEKHTRLNILV